MPLAAGAMKSMQRCSSNLALVPDRCDDFEAVELSTNNPRFGEFRIGAFPPLSVLAKALAYQ
jgi:hypothetical protein